MYKDHCSLLAMGTSDSVFLTLPLRLQRLIDKAFDLTTNLNHTLYDKVKINGSIPQQNETLNGISAGGFVIESYGSHPNIRSTSIEDDILDNELRSSIPLSLIPSALQFLDLPPDDAEVLSVFKNAACGWSSSSIAPMEVLDTQEKFVSREDWRSVCAVLLEPPDGENSSDDERLPRMSKSQDVDFDSEGYIEPESCTESAESSSDEYIEHHVKPRKKMQDQNSQLHLPSLNLDLECLSSRQKEACLKTFGLFFPEVPHHELMNRRIMIKDLQRVSKLLGEKIKAEEVNAILFLSIILNGPL